MGKVPAYLQYALYVVVLLAVIEFLFVIVSKRRSRDKRETTANFSIWLINQFIKPVIIGGVFLAVLVPVSKWAPYTLPVTGWTMFLTLIVADFVYYWNHRISHQVRLFWTYHSVHHSSPEYNLSTAIRLPWIGLVGDTMFYIPLVLVGFNPVLLSFAKSIVLLAQAWIHTEAIGKLGWFDKVFNSPSNHRVHHGSNGVYLDKNHGGILIIWDRLFGTYQEELITEPVIYGLTKPINSYNPWTINFHETGVMFKEVRGAKSFKEALGYVFKGPGWSPSTMR
jgi:sterol desaturase/sphingolipid hydroxylase (fatty acid hydroxylase superfamily)